ncbi:hypothetical protein ACB092_11G066900 [Castanea dentata]
MQQLIRSLKIKKYFQNLKLCKANVNTISGSSNLIEGSGRVIIMLPKGTKLCINDALYSSKPSRNLLNFKDIRYNGYHVETNNEGNQLKQMLQYTRSVRTQRFFRFGMIVLDIQDQ